MMALLKAIHLIELYMDNHELNQNDTKELQSAIDSLKKVAGETK